MKKTNAGGSLGVGIKRNGQTISLVPATPATNNGLRFMVIFVILSPFPVLVPAIYEFTRSPTERLVGCVLVAIFGLSIAAVLWTAAYLRARESGTLMVIDKNTGDVLIPNENKTFRHEQIDHLQVITVPGTGNYSLMEYTEINLITKLRDSRFRAPVAGDIDEYSLIANAINTIIEETDLPVFTYTVVRKKGGDEIVIGDMRKIDPQ